MFDSKFLRRLETKPSEDLARRRDLYFYQLRADLDPSAWIDLIYPESAQEIIHFNLLHNTFVGKYTRDILNTDSVFLFKTLTLPKGCKNQTVYNLCLVNRIRYELDYPLIDAEEIEWPQWAIWSSDPQFRKQFDNMIIAKLNNG